jgi:uncharacterized membrane protein/uncharacterized RDD family membrane protein YckC
VEGHFLWDLAGSGFWILLVIAGLLALILPGRNAKADAERIGLGRHVEALLVVSLIITLAIGTSTHVPVFIGPGGVIAVSLLGAVVPTILAIYFLVAAGWKRLWYSILPIALVSLAAYATSETVPDLGIIARPPYYFLPALIAAACALLVGWRSLHALPLAYTYGALGALIGADMLRIGWITGTPLTAASIGGADALDLVFLMGLWSAAFVAVPYAPRLLRMRPKDPRWTQIAQLARNGQVEEALEEAEAIVFDQLDKWRQEHGFDGLDEETVLHESTAHPVLLRLNVLRENPHPWDRKAVRQILEDLAGLERRLKRPYLPNVAPTSDRTLAGLIDLVPLVFVVIVAVVTAMNLPLTPRPGEAEELFLQRRFLAGAILVLWSAIAFHVLYPFFAEWFSGGRTLGKLVMRLQVRSRDGGTPNGWDYFIRNLTRLVDMLLLYLLPLVSPPETGRERLGDHFAQTYVAKIIPNIQSETTDETTMPPSAAQWSLETTRPPR